MKKVLFILAACLSIALCFTSCKLEIAKLTIEVEGRDHAPIGNRSIYYTTEANVYADLIAPAPDAPLRDNDITDLPSWSTNAYGMVTENIIANLTYAFFVKDEGSNSWKSQTVKLKEGEDKTITFTVNK
jgi:hypothetical protein